MLKKSTILSAILAAYAPAHADVGAMVGVGYTFGGPGLSLTVKALSSDRQDRVVAAAGVSFYPFLKNKIGVDLGVGYQGDNSAVVLSWDFLQAAPQISGGWANTKDNPPPPPAPVPPPPAPPPGPVPPP